MNERKHHQKALILFLLLTLPTFAWSQVTEEWLARYNGPANLEDQANAIVLDLAGNVYVTGFSYRTLAIPEFATIKYSSSGNQEWVARYSGSGSGWAIARAIALDSQNNVYVTGGARFAPTTDLDYTTIKYDSAGNQQWVATYNGPARGEDSAAAIAVDSEGNAYVTGRSAGLGTFSDYATVKYDTDGNQVWVARYNGPVNGPDEATAIAIDDAGNVYVTGASTGVRFSKAWGYRQDYATVKYDRNGNQLWVARYESPGTSDAMATAMTLHPNGNVVVTGYIGRGEPITREDFATIMYDTDGNEVWVAIYNSPQNYDEEALALAADTTGNVYVTGWTGIVGAVHRKYLTLKYDSAGSQQWLATYEGVGRNDDIATAIALDGQGNPYVTGWSYGIPAILNYDYATIRYNPEDGSEVWVVRYDGPAHNMDQANAIAVDDTGNVYVTGMSCATDAWPACYDYVTIKYSQP